MSYVRHSSSIITRESDIATTIAVGRAKAGPGRRQGAGARRAQGSRQQACQVRGSVGGPGLLVQAETGRVYRFRVCYAAGQLLPLGLRRLESFLLGTKQLTDVL